MKSLARDRRNPAIHMPVVTHEEKLQAHFEF
jgi:hypothetical protein